MKRYMIEDAKGGVTNGGMACGPVPGNAVATVRYTDGEGSKWLSLVEVDGFPIFYITDRDVYDLMVAEDPDNEEFMELQTKSIAGPRNGFDFGTTWYDVFEHFESAPDDPKTPLVRFLMTLIRCKLGEEERIIKPAIGKYADEVPVQELTEEDWC